MFGEKEIDALFIIAQSVGFIALGIAMLSFQAKRRITMLSMQTVSNLLWMLHYLLLGNIMSAVIANLIGIVRNIIYGLRGKYKFADSKIIPIASIIAFLISGVFTYTNPFDILPTLAMVFASIAFFVKEERIIRYISVLVGVCWLTFGIYAGSIAGIISDGSTLISIIIAIIRYRNFDIYEATTSQKAGDEMVEKSETDKPKELLNRVAESEAMN